MRAFLSPKTVSQFFQGLLQVNGFATPHIRENIVEWQIDVGAAELLEEKYTTSRVLMKSEKYEENMLEGISLLREAAEGGHSQAQFDLSLYLEAGVIKAVNDSEELKWLIRAANAGHSRAAYELGNIYFKGKGVRWDERLAMSWYLRAVELGDIDAPVGVGEMCDKGLGTSKDNEKALLWYKFGAERGSSLAHLVLQGVYGFGRLGQPKDMNKMKEHSQMFCQIFGERTKALRELFKLSEVSSITEIPSV